MNSTYKIWQFHIFSYVDGSSGISHEMDGTDILQYDIHIHKSGTHMSSTILNEKHLMTDQQIQIIDTIVEVRSAHSGLTRGKQLGNTYTEYRHFHGSVFLWVQNIDQKQYILCFHMVQIVPHEIIRYHDVKIDEMTPVDDYNSTKTQCWRWIATSVYRISFWTRIRGRIARAINSWNNSLDAYGSSIRWMSE